MPFALIPEYEGKSPYVFITYAQQDEKIAYSIAVKMYNEGFRLWSSAACGNPSNMRIAERLSNAEVAMVFLSRSYLKYASYREFEPRAVMNSPKKKIVICLDDTPLGTDWNTVDFPAGIRYNPDIPQELWLRINSSDTLDKCRGAWPRQPLPLPFEENRAVDVSVDAMDDDAVSDELSSLNALMASFDVGMDDRDARKVSLFNREIPPAASNRDTQPSQEQEYYTIENLIDNSPMPAQEEQQQYDHMVGLIGTIMERSHRSRTPQPHSPAEKTRSELMSPAPSADAYQPSYRDFYAVPKNEFDRVNLSKDISSQPVVITESSGSDRLSWITARRTATYRRTI
ncbi:MAG: toll/interleukin-1 receptor domain-containing protein [Clostridia bacterium]|nr:toll/interleukin-1 receptor domain-containing protein [Clostridia bacterium]